MLRNARFALATGAVVCMACTVPPAAPPPTPTPSARNTATPAGRNAPLPASTPAVVPTLPIGRDLAHGMADRDKWSATVRYPDGHAEDWLLPDGDLARVRAQLPPGAVVENLAPPLSLMGAGGRTHPPTRALTPQASGAPAYSPGPVPPTPTISRQEILQKAIDLSGQPAPEVDIREVRITGVTAELTTLGEADSRQGVVRGQDGYGPTRDQQTVVWWVGVRGTFTYADMAAPGRAPPVYHAGERIFVFDARTGELLGGEIPASQPVTPSAAP